MSIRILDEVIIYTDGACSGNPGKGGWGAILMFGDVKKEISGAEKETTNNRMELSAAIAALSAIASMRSGYGRNMELIHFSDFFMSKFCITEEDEKESEELCSAYISFMDKKFPTYRDDLYAYCDSLQDDEQQAPTSDKKPSTQDDGPVPTL